jgi:hypothetical protein
MVKMLVKQRYAFGDPNQNPDKLFQHVMAALRLYDGAYDLVWDRQVERWTLITWVVASNWRGQNPPKVLKRIEDDYGALELPSLALISWLHNTDWRNKAKSIEAYLDQNLRDQVSHDANYEQQMKVDLHYAMRPVHQQILRHRHSVNLCGTGWSPKHLKIVQGQLADSFRIAKEVTPHESSA